MNCICTDFDHSDFDQIVKQEMKSPVFVSDIVNDSYCISIDIYLDENLNEISLDINETLSGLTGKIGIYHLWIDADYCAEHFDHQMLCVYVGKGFAQKRIKFHIPDKWLKAKFYISLFMSVAIE
jgi:hypothetical protein